MTVVKQEETVMDLKIPANIMDLQTNQQPENAPISKRKRESSSSPDLKFGKEECSSIRRAKNAEEPKATNATEEATDASEEGNH